jgi:hypothetical protein
MSTFDRRPGRLFACGLAFCAGLLLAGCADPWQPGAGVLASPLGGEQEAAEKPTYCYRTLAEVDCYRVPLPEAEGRRVGWTDARENMAE